MKFCQELENIKKIVPKNVLFQQTAVPDFKGTHPHSKTVPAVSKLLVVLVLEYIGNLLTCDGYFQWIHHRISYLNLYFNFISQKI